MRAWSSAGAGVTIGAGGSGPWLRRSSAPSLPPTACLPALAVPDRRTRRVFCPRADLLALLSLPRAAPRPPSDALFKLVLIGDTGVGKSSLMMRFAVRCILCPVRRRMRHAAHPLGRGARTTRFRTNTSGAAARTGSPCVVKSHSHPARTTALSLGPAPVSLPPHSTIGTRALPHLRCHAHRPRPHRPVAVTAGVDYR